MQFLTVLSLVGLALANLDPAFEAPRELISRDLDLSKRACVANGCRCDSRNRQMTVCGACKWTNTDTYVVTTNRVLTNIYECNPSGGCCSYGHGSDCNTGSGRCNVY